MCGSSQEFCKKFGERSVSPWHCRQAQGAAASRIAFKILTFWEVVKKYILRKALVGQFKLMTPLTH